MKMNIRVIIFDLFGTLVQQFPLDRFETSLREMASHVGLDYQTFFNAWIGQTNTRRQTGAFSSFREEIARICQQNSIDPSEKGLSEAIRLRYEFTRSVLVPRPDAVSTLKSLKTMGYLRGLISDCSEEVPELWPETPFSGLLETEVFSCSVGMKKPNPDIYRLACERLNAIPEECIYIGDGFSNELSGAKACGMRPFLLLPPGERRPDKSTWEGFSWTGEILPSLGSILSLLEGRPNQALQGKQTSSTPEL